LPWWDKEVSSAKAYLQRRADTFRRAGIAVTTEVVIGENVAAEITAFASRVRADLIAIATHGRGGLARVLRGSVADAVTRSARNSTLVFHPDKTLENAGAENETEFAGFTPAIA
jgi:nucleotide-binding universal stress UspA family protein